MENASKALLIALIAVAMGIFGSARGVVGNAEGQIDSMAVKMHNQQFTMYDGEVSGSQVKECISKVLANNTKATTNDYKVGVTAAGLAYVTKNTSTGVTTNNTTNISDISNIRAEFIYTGVTTIGANGIITQITFNRKM